jgi:hypothetical protein
VSPRGRRSRALQLGLRVQAPEVEPPPLLPIEVARVELRSALRELDLLCAAVAEVREVDNDNAAVVRHLLGKLYDREKFARAFHDRAKAAL